MKGMKFEVLSLMFLAFGMPAFGADTVGLSLNLDINVERIAFESLEYFPESIATNLSTDWVESQQIITNGLFSGGDVVTNTVQTQIEVVTVFTNAPHWKAPFVYTIPAGAPLQIGASLSATPQRKALLDVDLVLTPAQLVMIIGPDFATQTQLASETFGALPVKGGLDAALKAAVLASLAGQ